MDIVKDDPRTVAGQKLVDTAYEYWKACQAAKQYGAVQWLEDSDGKVVIFTRGEYRQQLLREIHKLPDNPEINFFVKEGDDDHDNQ